MAFEITANKLERDLEIKVLKLESEEYSIKIFYYGDYKKDMEAGRCLAENLSMSCKLKKDLFPLALMKQQIYVEMDEGYTILAVSDVDLFKQKLDRSKEAAIELDAIVKQYFPM